MGQPGSGSCAGESDQTAGSGARARSIRHVQSGLSMVVLCHPQTGQVAPEILEGRGLVQKLPSEVVLKGLIIWAA